MSEAVGPRGPRIYGLSPLLAGSVADWKRHLPRIAGMGFNWIALPPLGYPGFSGSLYAQKHPERLNPLFRGPGYEPDDELVMGFIDAAAHRGLQVMVDLVVGQVSADCPLVQTHPAWFLPPPSRGRGDTWGDVRGFDYSPRPARDGLIAYWQDEVRRLVRLGFHGLRCDGAHTVPAEVWNALMAAAHGENPDVLFLAKALGCPPETVAALAPARFDYLYNSARWWDFSAGWLLEQYAAYRHQAPTVAFPEADYGDRLAVDLHGQTLAAQEREYRFRLLFCAAFSAAWQMPMGFEHGAVQPVDVCACRPGCMDKPRFDLEGFITAVNRMKAAHVVLNREGPAERWAAGSGAFAILRHHEAGPDWVLLAINPGPAAVALDPGAERVARVALSGEEITPQGPPAPTRPPLHLPARSIRLFAGAHPVPA